MISIMKRYIIKEVLILQTRQLKDNELTIF